MNTLLSKTIEMIVLFVLVFLTGFWLARSGKPYSVVVFTLHKLAALGAVIILGLMVMNLQRVQPMQMQQWLAVAVTVLFLAATIVTGGLLSVEKAMPIFVLRLHHIFPYLNVISIGVSLFLSSPRPFVL